MIRGRAERRIVYVVEEEESADDLADDRWLLGTFDAHLERGRRFGGEVRGLTAEEAVAWGRARAPWVLIRLGDSDYYSAGEESVPATPPWPPADLPPLVRRRPRGEEWKDRTLKDEPIEWSVEVQLSPIRGRVEGDPAVRSSTRHIEVPPRGRAESRLLRPRLLRPSRKSRQAGTRS